MAERGGAEERVRREVDRHLAEATALATRPVRLMEVCGTHTMAIGRLGLRSRLPERLRLISGPGCPVCVTPTTEIDRAIAMAREPGVVVLTFGDMMRVPGSASTLDRERAAGCDVRVIYSAADGLAAAAAEPSRTFVFLGVGFETTSPTVAAVLARAMESGVGNFLVLAAFRLIPPAMLALVSDGQARIDGFLCPGHVSAVIGTAPYAPLAREHGVPCVVTGFEAADILEGVAMILRQIRDGRPEVAVQYRRAVPEEGNPAARGLLERVFRRCDAEWRGLGIVPASGLELADGFSRFDARARLPVEVAAAAAVPAGCACGAVMRGLITPTECRLFGTQCVPSSPVGPCMVSSEGACAAWHRYG